MAEEAQEANALAAPMREFSGPERAAIFLLVVGEQEASHVLKHMSPDELQQVGEAMANLKDITQQDIHRVMHEFEDEAKEKTPLDIGTYDYLKKIMMSALGGQKANSILSKVFVGPNAKGIEALKWMDVDSIVEIIQSEHPQIICTLLTQLDEQLAGSVLEKLDTNIRSNVIERIATMDSISTSALEELDELIEDHFKKEKPGKVPSVGGPKIAAGILNNVSTDVETQVMDEVNERDRELGEKIKGLMFVFDNLLDVDDRGLQAILREAPQDKLVLGLKGASPEVRAKIFKNMSKRAAEMLQDDLEASGPVKLSDVEDAQKEILEVAMKLAEEGTIMLGGKGEDFV